MLRTLDRYVIREILPPLFLSLLIFTFVLDIPPVMDQLQNLVAKGVTWGVITQMLITLIPQSLGLTIPMALLVGILIGLGRISADREAVALLACGVSPYRLLRPVMALALVCGAAHLWVMISAIPNANQTFRQLSYEVVSKQVENDVQPQVFFQNFPGWVLYARDIPRNVPGWKDVLVADTQKLDSPKLYMARYGRLELDRVKQTVDLVLSDGVRYATNGLDGKQIETYRFPKELIVKIDPQSVFPRTDIMRGVNELTIPELQREAADKIRGHLSPHPEILAIQQKFSFPLACLVFAVIGIALGLTVARDGKLAGFVVGIAVIFAYYILLYLAESFIKGYYGADGGGHSLYAAYAARWVPNIILMPFGIIALVWRARWAEGRLPFRSAVRLTTFATSWLNRRRDASATGGAARGVAVRAGTRRTVIVLRVPRLSWLMPNILDRYISRIYLRTAALSFAGLLGIFYISTFIDKSDKLFKGQATGGMMLQLLADMTPQFVYYIIPLAALVSVLVTFGLLSRTSELSVMKACGISLYRIAAPLLVLGLAWSGVLYGLEQQVLAAANQRADAIDSQIRGRAPRLANPLNRQWVMGQQGDIYHYTYYDRSRHALNNLLVYHPAADAWRLDSELFTPRATFAGGRWIGVKGWQQDFTGRAHGWSAFAERPIALEPPEYFETSQPLAEMMTVPELKHFINEQAASGFNVIPETIELQKKLAFPFVTVVMTLLAIPFGMTTGKRGTLYGIGIGIVMALTYWIIGGAFAAIGKAGLLDPIVAGWAPNILTAGSAAYLLLTART